MSHLQELEELTMDLIDDESPGWTEPMDIIHTLTDAIQNLAARINLADRREIILLLQETAHDVRVNNHTR